MKPTSLPTLPSLPSFLQILSGVDLSSKAVRIMGTSKIDSCKIGSLESLGDTYISSSSIRNELRSSGSLTLKDCPQLHRVVSSGYTAIEGCRNIGEMCVSGQLCISDSLITGPVVKLSGEADMSNCTFSQPVEAATRIFKIHDTAIPKLIIQPIFTSRKIELLGVSLFSQSHREEQTVYVSGKQTNIGEIVFTDGAKGRVISDGNAQITASSVPVECSAEVKETL